MIGLQRLCLQLWIVYKPLDKVTLFINSARRETARRNLTLRVRQTQKSLQKRQSARMMSHASSEMSSDDNVGDLKKSLMTRVDMKMDGGKEYAVIHIPGFSFTDFDRTGLIPPWKVSKYIASARVLAFNMTNPSTGEPFLQISKFWKDMLLFYVASKIDFERDFYVKTSQMGPLEQSVHLGYVGTSSYNTLSKIYTAASNKLLLSSVSQLVSVGRETRKVKPLPEWWRETYSTMTSGEPSLKVDILQQPERTSEYTVTVAWSDSDVYRHTNMAVYVRYCFDAGAVASIAGEYKHFSGDLAFYPLRQLVVTYKRESVPGDVLRVTSWEAENTDEVIHFQIFKEETLLFQCTAVYYKDFFLDKENSGNKMPLNPVADDSKKDLESSKM